MPRAPTRAGQLATPTGTLLLWDGPLPGEIRIADVDAGTLTQITLPGVPKDYYGFVTTGTELIALSASNYPARTDGQAFSFHRMPPRPGDQPTPLGPATYAVPSVQGGMVWLETADQHVREVNASSGLIVVSNRAIPGRLDAAMAGGLIVEETSGAPTLTLWDPLTGHQQPIGAGQQPSMLAGQGSALAWVGGACLPACFHVTTFPGSDQTLPMDADYEGHHAGFSPDGRWLLVGLLTGRSPSGAPIFRVGLIHTGSDAVSYLGPPAQTTPMEPPVWSSNGSWAFFTFDNHLYAWHAGFTNGLTMLGDFSPEAAAPKT